MSCPCLTFGGGIILLCHGFTILPFLCSPVYSVFIQAILIQTLIEKFSDHLNIPGKLKRKQT